MANYYMLATLIGLALYITLFDTSKWQAKWSLSSKRKFGRVFILTWIGLYLMYLFCVMLTHTTRSYLVEHIVFGAFLHLIFALFAWKATIYY